MDDIYTLFFFVSPDIQRASGCLSSSIGDFTFSANLKRNGRGCRFAALKQNVRTIALSKADDGWRQVVPVMAIDRVKPGVQAVILETLTQLRLYTPLFVETAEQLIRETLQSHNAPWFGECMPLELERRKADLQKRKAPVFVPRNLPRIEPVPAWAF